MSTTSHNTPSSTAPSAITRALGQASIPIVETNSSNLGTSNNDWQVWSSRSVSPLSDVQTSYSNTPTASESRLHIPETVIEVTEDGWRTAKQAAPLKPHFDVNQHLSTPALPSPNSMYHAGARLEMPSADAATQWLSQQPNNPIRPLIAFSQPRVSTSQSAMYPTNLPSGPLNRSQILYADEFHQAQFFGMPAEEDFRNNMPMPLQQPQVPRPSMFPSSPTLCNLNSSRQYGTYNLISPAVPFTDYSFGFDAARNSLGPPPFPMPPSQINMASSPNVIYPNPVPIPPPGILDTRIIPVMSYEYPPRPPQFFFPSPVQMTYTLPVPFPSGPMLANPPNNFVNENRQEPQFPSSGIALPPRHSRHHRTQMRQAHPHTTSSFSHNGNRIGRRSNLMVPTLGARSSLMEEFRNSNKDKHWNLQDIFGYIVEFSRDQNGSRLIQQQLEDASAEDRHRVFDEIVPENTAQLIQDVFGNYVIQKFFDLGTEAQKDAISKEIEDNAVKYSVQIYACRVVQKAFEYMSEDQQNRIIGRLEGNLLACIKDEHGNHVIQKFIDTVAPERLTFLRIISANIPDLAANSNGCRVLQKCLSKLPKAQIQPLLDAVDQYCNSLMRDQYGNYVIQFILQHGEEDERGRVLAKIQGSMVELSKNQYASHVCEKAIVYSDSQTRGLLIGEILTTTGGENPIPSMIQDDFANYVLQRALTMAEGEQRSVLFHHVKSFLIPLRKSTTNYAKQMVKIERLVDKYFGKLDKTPSSV